MDLVFNNSIVKKIINIEKPIKVVFIIIGHL